MKNSMGEYHRKNHKEEIHKAHETGKALESTHFILVFIVMLV